ncbi:hypothetical protein ACI77I_29470 [Pseudomonas sp. D47]|uniref:hypothetical protein n=1 Tax=Pseudomonas sp. D47 TaxID=3159447 RepID=UPI00387B0F9E
MGDHYLAQGLPGDDLNETNRCGSANYSLVAVQLRYLLDQTDRPSLSMHFAGRGGAEDRLHSSGGGDQGGRRAATFPYMVTQFPTYPKFKILLRFAVVTITTVSKDEEN